MTLDSPMVQTQYRRAVSRPTRPTKPEKRLRKRFCRICFLLSLFFLFLELLFIFSIVLIHIDLDDGAFALGAHDRDALSPHVPHQRHDARRETRADQAQLLGRRPFA